MKFIWYGFLICDACVNAWPAMVKEEWAAPFPKLGCFRCGELTARPLGPPEDLRFSEEEWPIALPLLLQRQPWRSGLSALPKYRHVEFVDSVWYLPNGFSPLLASTHKYIIKETSVGGTLN